jgi:hypothetical protein
LSKEDRLPIVSGMHFKGIQEIDGSEMPYGSWYLLNEAINCYYNYSYYACLTTLSACVESWLRRQIRTKKDFIELISEAESQGIITGEEAKTFNDLRGVRNNYVHLNIDKLPKITHITEGRVVGNQILFDVSTSGKVNPYPTEAHKEFVPLFMLAPTAYIPLNKVIAFFKKRYPNKDNHINVYVLGIIQQFNGLSKDEMIIPLKPTPSKKKKWFSKLKRLPRSKKVNGE